ncbi:unnamed protein product [Amoebophrya sp. A25]|nr:unnamed protein product [Amoebophrya sp. A25]|eukprot:GSA25T00022676001.1
MTPPTTTTTAASIKLTTSIAVGDNVYLYVVKRSLEFVYEALGQLIILIADWRIQYQMSTENFLKHGMPAHASQAEMWRLSYFLMNVSLVVRETIYYVQEIIVLLIPDDEVGIQTSLLHDFSLLFAKVDACHNVTAFEHAAKHHNAVSLYQEDQHQQRAAEQLGRYLLDDDDEGGLRPFFSHAINRGHEDDVLDQENDQNSMKNYDHLLGESGNSRTHPRQRRRYLMQPDLPAGVETV